MFKFKLCKVRDMQQQLDRIFDEIMAEMMIEIWNNEMGGERCE